MKWFWIILCFWMPNRKNHLYCWSNKASEREKCKQRSSLFFFETKSSLYFCLHSINTRELCLDFEDKCYLFCSEHESTPHLYFACTVVRQVWMIIDWLCDKKHQSLTWLVLRLFGGIWKLRNHMCFQNRLQPGLQKNYGVPSLGCLRTGLCCAPPKMVQLVGAMWWRPRLIFKSRSCWNCLSTWKCRWRGLPAAQVSSCMMTIESLKPRALSHKA